MGQGIAGPYHTFEEAQSCARQLDHEYDLARDILPKIPGDEISVEPEIF